MVNSPKKHRKNNRKERKHPSGYSPRGAKGSTREKLAKASGFRSDKEITQLLSASDHNQKLVTILQRVLSELVKDHTRDELTNSPVTHHYAGLIHALSGNEPAGKGYEPIRSDITPANLSEQRQRKRENLGSDALRQAIIEAAETPLSMIPSLLADNRLSDKEKLQRLTIYTRSLEMLYEPLQLEPIGDPGEKSTFDPRIHESAVEISPGETCMIKRIGFIRGELVIRRAVVEEVKEKR